MNEDIPEPDYDGIHTPDIKRGTMTMILRAYKEYAERRGWVTGQEASRRAYSGQSFYGTKEDNPE